MGRIIKRLTCLLKGHQWLVSEWIKPETLKCAIKNGCPVEWECKRCGKIRIRRFDGLYK